MTTFIFLAVVLVIFSFVLASKMPKKEDTGEEKYVAKNLLTTNEKKWFAAFKDGMPQAHVFSQVALNQLVKAEGVKWRSAQNKIAPRSIDFVLLNEDLAVLMAIEIDDRSHNKEQRRLDDEKKNKALRDAGITLLRFPATPVLSGAEIKKAVLEALIAKVHSARNVKAT